MLCVFVVLIDGVFNDDVVKLFEEFRNVGVVIFFVGLGIYFRLV